MKTGDKVRFKGAVIKRTMHDGRVVAMRGVVLSVKGNIAQVDCQGTYNSEEGNSVRWIPIANLCAYSDTLKMFVDNQ